MPEPVPLPREWDNESRPSASFLTTSKTESMSSVPLVYTWCSDLSPIVAGTSVSEGKIIQPEKLSKQPCAKAVHGS